MARTIFKYEVSQGRSQMMMPLGAELIYADGIREAVLERWATEDTPRHRFFVWAVVNRDARAVTRHFGIFLTGDPIPDDWQHVASFQVEDTDGSPFLGHVFDGGER